MSEQTSRARDAGVDGEGGATAQAATAATARKRRRRVIRPERWAAPAALLLLTALVCLEITILPLKTITVDEVVHIPAGYGYLTAGAFELNSEHPPLVKVWAALPFLFLRPAAPPLPPDVTTPRRRTLDYGATFWELNRARFEELTFWARVQMAILAAALGWVIFAYARWLFGAGAALCAVALYCLEPTILAHARIVQTDVPAALAYLGFFFALHRYLVARSLRRAAILGLVLGLGLATKFSLGVLVPVLLLACAVAAGRAAWRGGEGPRPLLRRAGDLAAILVLALLVVNLAYLGDRRPLPGAELRWIASYSPEHAATIARGIALATPLVPPLFLFGVYDVAIHSNDGHRAALLGMQRLDGWPYYFPVAFALKTTLPFLLAALGALGWAAWRLVARRDWRLLPLLGPLALYALISALGQINIGIRHFLPAFPFLIILAGAACWRLWQARVPRLVPALALALLLGGSAVADARAYPDYLSYMNALTWQRQPWWYLADSNVEWGEDFPALARYLRERGETTVNGSLAGGPWLAAPFGLTYHDFGEAASGPLPDSRYVAIGASVLNGATIPDGYSREAKNLLAPFWGRTPEAIIGGSIYVYRVR